MRTKRTWLIGSAVIAILLALVILIPLIVLPWYTRSSLESARRHGVFSTPEEGVLYNANLSYCGIEKVEIEKAGTNSFDGSDPHIWYVIYKVFAANRAPCSPENPGPPLAHNSDSEGGGTFFLHMKDGWVWMPEGRFPVLIGRWMKKLDLAGPGLPD